MSDTVTYETRGNVALITLNRPDARNAVNGDVAQAMEAAIDRLEDDDSVWVGIIQANTEGQTNPVFCAGADLKAINSGQGGALATERGGFAGFTYRERKKPVIVAVDGLATAGGCEIVLAADLVVATTRSAFGLAEVKRNLIAGAGGLFRLPRAIGRSAAMELILTGEPFPARAGLRARPRQPPRRAREGDRRRASSSPGRSPPLPRSRCGRAARSCCAAATEDDDTLKAMTDAAMAKVMRSEDLKEGLTAFIEKRAPQWTGR